MTQQKYGEHGEKATNYIHNHKNHPWDQKPLVIDDDSYQETHTGKNEQYVEENVEDEHRVAH